MHALVISSTLTFLIAADDADPISLEKPDGWATETLPLPTSFAPTMTLRGFEEVRFAPGMFDAKSDSFFSYAFVFRIDPKPALTKTLIERELLTYYRGLAAAVLKANKKSVDVTKFTLTLKQAVSTVDDAIAPGLVGDLKWTEPFVTQRPQVLHLEVTNPPSKSKKYQYLAVCVSPLPKDADVWKQLRKVRDSLQAE